MRTPDPLKLLKPLIFLLGILPFGLTLFQIYLLQSGAANELGADPAKELVHIQGEWALRFLVLTLLVTPARRITGWNPIQRVRRMLGLFTFFYASMHLMAYVTFLLELDLANITEELVERPYITAGFAAYLTMLPLAVTSNDWSIRKLRQRWARLHRIVYGTAGLAILHLVWLSKASYLDAFIYGSLMALLLGYRLARWARGRMRA